jgi:flagellar transcriptional activator FlhD
LNPVASFDESGRRRSWEAKMNGCDIHDSIREVNLSYLALVQRMLRESGMDAIVELRLSMPLAQVLADLSREQLLKLAARDQLICSFHLSGHAILGTLTARAAQLPAPARRMGAAAA